jgi:hypothetical protein
MTAPLAGQLRAGRRRALWRTVRRVAAVIAATAAALAVSFVVAGTFGLVVTADCLAALALIIALARTPGGQRDRRVRPGRPGALLDWDRLWLRRTPPSVTRPGDFPAYAKISSDLSWAPVSKWHYDHGVRPLLTRLLESVLAERHRVDLTADPARARRLVGDEIWPLIDPSRPPSFDSKAPGTDLRALTRIVDRLEQL